MKTICHVRENFFSLLSRFGYKRTKKYKEAHKRTKTYKDVNVALGVRYICNVIKQAIGRYDPDFVVTFLSNQKDILTKKNTNDIEIAISGNRLLQFIK